MIDLEKHILACKATFQNPTAQIASSSHLKAAGQIIILIIIYTGVIKEFSAGSLAEQGGGCKGKEKAGR